MTTVRPRIRPTRATENQKGSRGGAHRQVEARQGDEVRVVFPKSGGTLFAITIPPLFLRNKRARQREADETALDKLDDEFRLISDSGVLSKVLAKGVGHLKPDGWEKGSSRKQSRDDKLGKNGTKFGFQELEGKELSHLPRSAD